jgi:hypothetical protein
MLNVAFNSSHAESYSITTTSLLLPLATSSPASCTTPSSPRCSSISSPPPALRTPLGRARGCRCRPETLWPWAGRRCSIFCGYVPVVFARTVRASGVCAHSTCQWCLRAQSEPAARATRVAPRLAKVPRCSFPHDRRRRIAPCRQRSVPHRLFSSSAAAAYFIV